MRRRTRLAALLLAAVMVAGCGTTKPKDARPAVKRKPAQDPPRQVAGDWSGAVTYKGRQRPLGLELRSSSKGIGGALILRPPGRVRRVPITEAWLHGDRLAILIRDGKQRLLFRLVLKGDRLTGETAELGNTASVKLARKR